MIHVSRKVTLPANLSVPRVRDIAKATLKTTGNAGDVSIVFTDDKEIQQLNRDYRHIDLPTDVLAFNSDEIDPMTNTRYLGDIIISVERAEKQAQQAANDISDELTMLIVHGCLHLAGLDHITNQEKEKMRISQEAILASLGVKNSNWPREE